ncbi:MAG: short-chain dehydrogenase [Acidimicrobiales bacterium mtb01]|nr:SDR family oxidoreductase [Actinomycetota bacterium]TEX47898.1 MAG: short-chain dehydrogenase [Acidimicrobiales bacterium mtb01]
MEFAGTGVVVTGAAGGIGEALARRFHALGSTVVLADVLEKGVWGVADALNTIRPDSALAVVADLRSEDGNRRLVETAQEHLSQFGSRSGIDLFFANAGVGTGTFVESTPEADWDLAFDVNVHAHRWAAKYLLPRWLERGSGYFCSTASAAGLLAQIGSAPYSVTKHAAVAFAEWMSLTYGDRGVRVSCLCPQGVNTRMLSGGDIGDSRAGDVVRSAGVVLEPEQVAHVVAEAIIAERFLILPHPEVHDFEIKKTADRDRWLAGMRKLQHRVFGDL